MKRSFKYILIIFLLISIVVGCGNFNHEENIENDNHEEIIEYDNVNKLKLDNYKFMEVKESNDKIKYRILVIDIDPILTDGNIEGVSCRGKKASECLKQNKTQAINELVKDLNDSSHNYLDVVIEKTEYKNEFPKYKNKVTLKNGRQDYKFDEETWLDIFKDGWYKGIYDERVQGIGNWFGTFDYDYIIKKLNLVERKNNNEFDEVWIVNIDPSLTYESIMVGNNSFWMNGEPIEANCKPFKMMNVSISRPDANFECFGHATEQLLNNVFANSNYKEYNALNWNSGTVTIDKSNYNKLSLFQKFMLTDYQNTINNSGYAGVGNMHYSPNSTKDYEWNNKNNKVLSKYSEWENYPNLNDSVSTNIFTPSVYMEKTLNGTNSDARLHHRWWFGLLPHHTGLTSDGYSNNWWDYYRKNTYITNIVSDEYTQNFNVGDKISISLILEYSDGTKENIEVSLYDQNIEIDNKDLFYVDKKGQIYARKSGKANFVYYRDGVYGEINIIVN